MGAWNLMVVKRRRPSNEKEQFAIVPCLKTWWHYLGLHKAKVYTDNMSLKYFEIQAQVKVKSLQWHDSLAFMKVDLIHKPDHGNVLPDALNRWEVFQAMRTIQTLWLIFANEGNLWCKIRERYIYYLEAQKLLGELCINKVLKEVKLVDGLFKYKQSWVFVPQHKLRLLVLKEECNSHIVGHRRKTKNRHRMVLERYHWRYIKKNIAHFVKVWMKCHVKQDFYQKQGGSLEPLPIPSGPW